MKRARRWGLALQWALGGAAWLCACGGGNLMTTEDDAGQSDAARDDAPQNDAAQSDGTQNCQPIPCPSNAPWNQATCACTPPDSGAPAKPEAGTDATNPLDATVDGTADHDSSTADATPDTGVADATYRDQSIPDTSALFDVGPVLLDTGLPDVIPLPFPDSGCFLFCGSGFVQDPTFCQCDPCTNTCPNGQTPSNDCNDCVACSLTCPSDFDYGPNCSCIPHDAGPLPPPPGPDAAADAGVSCQLGFQSCPANTWCEFGICPDGTTQYGCFCNGDGTSTCDLSCPTPPDCDIPGAGTCPFGSECAFGSCATDPSSELFVCQCSSRGQAFCFTTGCEDGGAFIGDAGPFNQGDGGSAGGCLLEGFVSCPAGSFCQLGTCPDGTTPFGCTCNADGTASCDLDCPPPAPCVIPGEGTCPPNTQCTFGSCNGNLGTLLNCSCFNGQAECESFPCGESDGF